MEDLQPISDAEQAAFCVELAKRLNLMRRQDHLCDVTLVTKDDKEFKATSFPGYSLYFEKVPWLRLVTCLSMPTQAAPRVGPQLNFVNTTV